MTYTLGPTPHCGRPSLGIKIPSMNINPQEPVNEWNLPPPIHIIKRLDGRHYGGVLSPRSERSKTARDLSRSQREEDEPSGPNDEHGQ